MKQTANWAVKGPEGVALAMKGVGDRDGDRNTPPRGGSGLRLPWLPAQGQVLQEAHPK